MRIEKKISIEEKINIFNDLKQKLINDYPQINKETFKSIKDSVIDINNRKEIEDVIYTHLINIPQSIVEATGFMSNGAYILLCVGIIIVGIGIIVYISNGQGPDGDFIDPNNIENLQNNEAFKNRVLRVFIEEQRLRDTLDETARTLQDVNDMYGEPSTTISAYTDIVETIENIKRK